MKTIFCDRFRGTAADNWNIEQHVPEGCPDFVVRGGAMIFLDAGNRLLPRLPHLHDFMIEGSFSVDWAITERRFSLQIYFDYDPLKRVGMRLDLFSDGRTVSATLENNGITLTGPGSRKRLLNEIVKTGRADFTVRAAGPALTVRLNGKTVLEAAIERRGGVIALGRGVFIGELRLHSFRVDSGDPHEEEMIWNNLEIPFAPVNGMDNPVVWSLTAQRVGGTIRLRVKLSGGCIDRPVIPWFPYHGRYIEELTAPYLRIETDAAPVHLCLTGKTLVLCHHPQQHFYLLGPEQPEWPLLREFHLNDCDLKHAVLACGYRAYNGRAINKHLAAGPSETVYHAGRGAVVYHGEALEPGGAAMELHSPPDKRICRELPPTVHDYGKAAQFARLNHYFMDGEPCLFRFEIHSRSKVEKQELRLEYRLENAFFEPLRPWQTAAPESENSAAMPDTTVIRTSEIRFDGLAAGVYHIRFRLRRGILPMLEKHRAFEIFSGGQSGPAASELPVLFSLPNEIMGAETDYFDPWKPDCVDVSHYISVGCSIMPHFAREKRLWELYRFYRRRWFLWLTSRTAQDYSPEHNRDLIAHCDYLESHNEIRAACLVRPASRAFYRSAILRTLYEFACERDFHPARIKSCLENQTPPPLPLFRELAEKRFYEWLDFFMERYLAASRKHKAKIAETGAAVKFSGYGPAPVYGAAYKTAHCVSYLSAMPPGRETGAIHDGFFVLEDYPHACRYSIHRGPFLLADIRLKYPSWTVYPEMYTPFGEPCPDAAVARAWPGVGMWGDDFPLNCTVKRVIEYVYGAVCHDGECFRYWRNRGFHTRVWERERYEALLRFWGLANRAPAVRPLRASAFISSEACCRAHALCYDEYPGGGCDALGDLFNTAEEAIPYAYEMSRIAGQNAGFVTDFPALKELDADSVDILVLPPLTAVPPEALAQIRRLHAEGAALLAFEEATGLEDLFGVRPGTPETIHHITVNRALENNPLADLPVAEEYTIHRACRGKYRSAGAEILLDAEVPVLFLNRTAHGWTALFNVPPTAVRRQDQPHRVGFGRDSISPLVNGAVQKLFRFLSRPEAAVSEGKLIAFRDAGNAVRLIVMEDSHPGPARKITPLVSLNLPGLSPENISCDRAFSLVECSRDGARIRLALGPDEFAVITIADPGNPHQY